ncbi:hypothetical protein [Sanguibacter suaedae]|uniref:Uncharacterized protein n=1 Tax=Sanguibacter suaedae TaxID=2795737 RepID=A0A934IBF3_9MICO|nr:hypothetical protein [Sanguibacter suaedae]MBI9115342.1 hypothetical protein [Sanguibacter suaedae]
MARLFWVGTGAALTVAVVLKGRQVARRYAPAALVDRATESVSTGRDALGAAAGGFMVDFRAARDSRAAELEEALLAPTQGTAADLRARRDSSRDRATAARYAADHDQDDDEDTLGYSF